MNPKRTPRSFTWRMRYLAERSAAMPRPSPLDPPQRFHLPKSEKLTVIPLGNARSPSPFADQPTPDSLCCSAAAIHRAQPTKLRGAVLPASARKAKVAALIMIAAHSPASLSSGSSNSAQHAANFLSLARTQRSIASSQTHIRAQPVLTAPRGKFLPKSTNNSGKPQQLQLQQQRTQHAEILLSLACTQR